MSARFSRRNQRAQAPRNQPPQGPVQEEVPANPPGNPADAPNAQVQANSVVVPEIKFPVGKDAADEPYMWDGIRPFNHKDVDIYQRVTRQFARKYAQARMPAASHFTINAQKTIADIILSLRITEYTFLTIHNLWKNADHEEIILILQQLFKPVEETEDNILNNAISGAILKIKENLKKRLLFFTGRKECRCHYSPKNSSGWSTRS